MTNLYRVKEPQPWPKAIELAEGGTFKLTFTVVDTASGEATSSKQAHLLFQDLKGEEDVMLPVTVKDNGKAGFTIVSPHPFLPSGDMVVSKKLIQVIEHGQTASRSITNTRSILTYSPPLLNRLLRLPTSLPTRPPLFADIHPQTYSPKTTRPTRSSW